MDNKLEIRVKPSIYQPKKAEVEESVTLNGTPEELRSSVMKSVHVIEDNNA